MSKKYFGTDGIRGRVGNPPITPDFMLKLGWAAGTVFSELGGNGGGGRRKIIIGKDTRVSGYMFEAALEAGITAAGVDINLTGPMPTPAIAYLTRTLRAQAGIVISASHNRFEDNGIKLFSGEGAKLPDDLELAIEERLERPLTTVTPQSLGKATRIMDAAGRYTEFCKSTIAPDLKLNGLKLAVDCAHGSTYHIAPSVFEELGAQVVTVGASPDGFNINEDSGSTSPQTLQKTVLAENADLGIAFDGDGDRLIMADHQGVIVDGDEILYLIADDRRRRGVEFGGVVGTAMSNLGMELALKALKVPFARAEVGDRHVVAEMMRRGWRLGGESSGHILCLDITTTGDGLVSALQALSAVVAQGRPLADLTARMRKLPQSMVNVKTAASFDIKRSRKLQVAVSDVEHRLGKSGRVLLRPSGTEPVVRVMVEGEDMGTVRTLARELSEVVAQEVAQEVAEP